MTKHQVGMRGFKRTIVAAAVAATGLVSGNALAGGLLLYEVGTADVGLASAGYSAARRMRRRCSPTPPA